MTHDSKSALAADRGSSSLMAAASTRAGPPACPVCEAAASSFFDEIDGRVYWRCDACIATFLDRAWFPSLDEECRHYALHENDVDNPGYRQFLGRIAGPLLERLPPAQQGLDYGCGPGPALAAILCEAGHRMHVYDPIFAPDPAPLQRTYDFVTCTETAEHFHAPVKEFARLKEMLRPGGVLALMTCFQTEDARFADWHYRKDPTHVVFYREKTFRTLASLWDWRAEIPVKDVVFLFKPEVACMTAADA